MVKIYKKYIKSVVLAWAGCLLLFLFLYIILVGPQRKCKEQIAQQLVEKKQTYEAMLKLDQTDAKVQLKKQIEQWGDKLKDYIVNPEDLASLTFDIGQIANDIKVDSFSVKSQDSRKSQDIPGCQYLGENQINVSFKADFNKFAAFLNAMERHRPVIFVNKFKIAHTPNEDESASQVSMDLSVFVKKPQGT